MSDKTTQASTPSTAASGGAPSTKLTTAKPAAAAAQKESKDAVLSRLMKLEPKELMTEIVSGHVPLSLLNQVAGRMPAEMLQEAVDFLSKTDSDVETDAKATAQTQPGEQSPVLAVSTPVIIIVTSLSSCTDSTR